jgi:hypothetical protein
MKYVYLEDAIERSKQTNNLNLFVVRSVISYLW